MIEEGCRFGQLITSEEERNQREDPDNPVTRIHSGIRPGRNALIDYIGNPERAWRQPYRHKPKGDAQVRGRRVARVGGACAAAVFIN